MPDLTCGYLFELYKSIKPSHCILSLSLTPHILVGFQLTLQRPLAHFQLSLFAALTIFLPLFSYDGMVSVLVSKAYSKWGYILTFWLYIEKCRLSVLLNTKYVLCHSSSGLFRLIHPLMPHLSSAHLQ
jgi:hypothetical protein